MWAVSVAIDDAPRSEIDTLAFLSAIESLIPSPTKQTLRPSFWSFVDVVGLVGGQDLGEVAVHPQRFGQLPRRGLMVARDDRDVLDPALAQPLDDLRGPRAGPRPAARSPRPAGRRRRPSPSCGLRGAPRRAPRATSGGISIPSISMNRLLPTRIVCPSTCDRDAVADLVLRVVGRRQLEAELLGLVQDRQRDRVMELRLGGGRELEDLLGREAVGWR